MLRLWKIFRPKNLKRYETKDFVPSKIDDVYFYLEKSTAGSQLKTEEKKTLLRKKYYFIKIIKIL